MPLKHLNTRLGMERPTAIICNAKKGQGGFSDFLSRHKVVMEDSLLTQEIGLQQEQRDRRVQSFFELYSKLSSDIATEPICEKINRIAKTMNLGINYSEAQKEVNPVIVSVQTQRAPIINKKIVYNLDSLPKCELSKEYSASNIITSVMKVIARDNKVVSINSDISFSKWIRSWCG